MNYEEKVAELEAILLKAGFTKPDNRLVAPLHYKNQIPEILDEKWTLVIAVTLYSEYVFDMAGIIREDSKKRIKTLEDFPLPND